MPHDGEYTASVGTKRGDYWGTIGNTFKVGKKFTRRNIRHNLSLQSGRRKAKKYQAHHTMPVKFEHRFKKRKLNIHNPKYLRWWCSKKGVKGNHQSTAREYNRRWAHFFKKHPHASKKKVLKFRTSITRKYRKFYKCPGDRRMLDSAQ